MFGASKKLLGCLILGSLLVHASSHGQTPTQQPQLDSPKKQVASGNKTTKQPKRDTKDISSIVKESPASKDNQKPNQIPDQNDKHPTPDWWLIGVTGLLVIATAGLVYYARDTARRQLRAYVGIDKANVTQPVGVIQGYIAIKNFGQTPAYNVRIWQMSGTFDPGETPFFPASPNPPDVYPMLGAGSFLEVRPEMRRSQDQVSNIASGRGEAYAWGEVRYRDTFMNERRYAYRMRIRYADDRWQMQVTPEGNEAD